MLKSIDWGGAEFGAILIENNFKHTRVQDFLRGKGYSLLGNLGSLDDIYVPNQTCTSRLS